MENKTTNRMRKRYWIRFLDLESQCFSALETIFEDSAEYSKRYRVVSISLSKYNVEDMKKKVLKILSLFPGIKHDLFISLSTDSYNGTIKIPQYVLDFIRCINGSVLFSYTVV